MSMRPVSLLGEVVGYAMGAGSPVLASTTVSDLRKSSTLSSGTARRRLSPSMRALRSK